MSRNQRTQRTEPRTAEEFARERVADVEAAQSTGERTRPVALTNDDERKARAASHLYEVEQELPNGRRQVVRVHAASEDDARRQVLGDPDAPPSVVAVESATAQEIEP